VEKMHDGNGLRVQVEMISRTHKCLRGNGLIDHLTGVEKIADGKSLTNTSHTVNSYLSYVLVVLQKIDSLKKKKRRFIIMTMTRNILEIIQSKKNKK
jgi:hypothetical protein